MSLVAAARISGGTSQQVFDTLLRSLSEPGTVRQLPVELLPDVPPPLWLALGLADVDIAVSVDADPTSPMATLVRDVTGATICEVEDAWLVVLQSPATATTAVLDNVSIGTALAPEDGARVAIGVDGFGPGGVQLTLAGPGVDGERSLSVHGLEPTVADRLGQESGAFPTGFDTWLIAPNGDVVAIPRSTRVRRN